MAVQVLTYELRLQMIESPVPTFDNDIPPASGEEMEHFYTPSRTGVDGDSFSRHRQSAQPDATFAALVYSCGTGQERSEHLAWHANGHRADAADRPGGRTVNDDSPIYLDYAATTPMHPQVVERMQSVRATAFANPASNHPLGRQSQVLVDTAAAQLAELLGAAPENFIWTSGATESNNLALRGAARQRAHRGTHLISMRTEHKAVVDVMSLLEDEGFDVTWLAPDARGVLKLETLRSAIRDDTQLVSIMHINNETGATQDIAAIGAMCREQGVYFHVDAAQSVGKVPLDLNKMPIDLMSLTAHKFYGPSGVGSLYIADEVHIEPLMAGGPQQRRLRPGTVPAELIVGLGEAARVAQHSMQAELKRLKTLHARFVDGVRDIEGVRFNGDPAGGYPGIVNVSCADVDGEALLLALEPLCVASGSACNSQSQEPSHVLRAMGLTDREADSAIRFSFGRGTRREDCDAAVARYCCAVQKLRQLAPPELV